MRHISYAVTLCLLFAGITIADSRVPANFTHHGVAVPAARSFGSTAVEDSHGQRLLLIWLGDHNVGARSKLVIDIDTEQVRQIPVDLSRWDTARGLYLSSDNKWYAHFGHRFFEFDPEQLTFTFEEETQDRRSYALTEDANGLIWGVQNPDAHLVSFDPATRELTDHGSLNDEDWPQYARTIAVGKDGWIYAGISIVSGQVVGYNPEDGEIRRYVDETDRERGRGAVYLGTDGYVYATAPGWGWHRLTDGEATAVEGDRMPVEQATLPAGYHAMVKDGYSDGSRIVDLDVPNRLLKVEEADGSRRLIEFDYEARGARIYSLTVGPDGAIYGGTGQPTHLFRLDTRTGQITDKHMSRGGHLNAMIAVEDRIYGAWYSGGGIYEYEANEPWAFGDDVDDEASNPRRIVEEARPEITRPTALKAHPDGRHLIMAGSPRGGRTAGGLYVYDLETREGELISHEDLLENLNTRALAALPDGTVVAPTTVRPGTGGEQRAEEAELYLFDLQSREVVWRGVILPGREDLRDVVVGPEGLVYGIAGDATLFVFDPEAREVVHQASMSDYGSVTGSQAPRSMAVADDGTIYLLLREAIMAIQPGERFAYRKVAEPPNDIRVGIVIHEERLFFSTMTDLWSYRLR